MPSIEQAFNHTKPLIGYLTAGDGDTLRYGKALIEGGVSIIELGMPFSDPIADGPVIRKAMERSLKCATTLTDLFHIAKVLSTDIPIILFSYANPLLAYGDTLYADARAAGIAGILIVDLPLEEADEHLRQCAQHNLAPIFVISPSTTPQRMALIAKASKGFLYYACQKGTTGMRGTLPPNLKAKIAQIKQLTQTPVAVGFGVSSKTMADDICQVADGVIVGSYFVQAIAESKSPEELKQLALQLS